jgi:hypothetical protein
MKGGRRVGEWGSGGVGEWGNRGIGEWGNGQNASPVAHSPILPFFFLPLLVFAVYTANAVPYALQQLVFELAL